MKGILLLKGLPSSGKTTYAKSLSDKSDVVRLSKSDIRKMLGVQWDSEIEHIVEDMQYRAAEAAIDWGYAVILDDTNFNPEHEKAFRKLAKDHQIPFKVKDMETSLEVCLERNDKKVGRKKVPESAIIKMWERNYGEEN